MHLLMSTPGSLSRRWHLPWPVVPPRLWGTGAALAVVSISLIFRQEIWAGHPRAGQWSQVAAGGLLLLAGLQAIGVLWAWQKACSGPGWLRLLLWGGAVLAIVGISVLLLAALVFTGVSLARVL